MPLSTDCTNPVSRSTFMIVFIIAITAFSIVGFMDYRANQKKSEIQASTQEKINIETEKQKAILRNVIQANDNQVSR